MTADDRTTRIPIPVTTIEAEELEELLDDGAELWLDLDSDRPET